MRRRESQLLSTHKYGVDRAVCYALNNGRRGVVQRQFEGDEASLGVTLYENCRK